MNRPNKDRYVYCSGAIFDSTKYEEVLETYCGKLEKALDKACEMLAMNEESITLDSSYHDKEQWKEYLLKDE